MNKGYYFPLRNGGIKDGINDPGIETFNGTPIYSMTKETIQNSIDARKSKDKPVKVKFKLTELEKNNIPYINEYSNIFNRCSDYWSSSNEKTKVFLNESISLLSKEKISILEISDYNTTGLKGANTEEDSPFNDLVKSIGVSNKDGNSGGSFGIGKNAPFSCTKLRTVIYSTKDEDNIVALEGVCRLVTHKEENNKDTVGTGFLCVVDKEANGDIITRPFINEEVIDNINEYFIRDEIGTSVFVIGFSTLDGWINKIIDATLDYYFMAIYEGNLEVEVEDTVINKETLNAIMIARKESWQDHLTYNYYKSISLLETSDKVHKFEEENFMGLGKVSLYLYLDNDLPKRIALVRGLGMKIIDKDRFRLTTNFVGVLRIEGNELNKFIRSLENPSHNKIEPERIEDSSRAKKVIKGLFDWVKNMVKELEAHEAKEEIEIEGLGKYLPNIEGVGEVEAIIREGAKRKIKKVNLKEKEKQRKCNKKIKILANEMEDAEFLTREDEGASTFVNEGRSTRNENGEKGNDGSSTNGDSGQNKADIDGNSMKKKTKTKNKHVPLVLEKSRIFCIDKNEGKYRLILKSKNSSQSNFQLRVIGEDGYDIAKIKSVESVNGEIIECNISDFGPIKIKKGEEKHFNISLQNSMKYSLEVVPYANNL